MAWPEQALCDANAPLDKFFAIAIDDMQMIKADEYLFWIIWAIDHYEWGSGALVLSVVSNLPGYSQATNVSVDDLVEYCTKS